MFTGSKKPPLGGFLLCTITTEIQPIPRRQDSGLNARILAASDTDGLPAKQISDLYVFLCNVNDKITPESRFTSQHFIPFFLKEFHVKTHIRRTCTVELRPDSTGSHADL
ncbi:MAG TPA: hypothetical protein VF800_29905 [Telluria sp.]